MPKQTRTPHFDVAELEAMTSQQKLDRMVYLQKEIDATIQRKKDEAKGHSDYVKELREQQKEIADSEQSSLLPGDVQSAAVVE